MCDTTEMADALNQRLHHETVGADAPTVTGARGHRIAMGDLIITRRNDPTTELRNTSHPAAEQIPVRNGNRWRVTAIDSYNGRLAADALTTRARVVFDNDYLREHITYGYAVTVHSAQGVTADTTHAVLGETTPRSLLYVACHAAVRPTSPTSASVQLNVSMTTSRSTACKALSAEPAGTPVASLERSSPMTATGRLPPTVLQPRPRSRACPTASEGCSAAESPQSIVGERSTQSGRQNRELSSTPWLRAALGTPAGTENTVSTTGSTSSQSRSGAMGFDSRQLH